MSEHDLNSIGEIDATIEDISSGGIFPNIPLNINAIESQITETLRVGEQGPPGPAGPAG